MLLYYYTNTVTQAPPFVKTKKRGTPKGSSQIGLLEDAAVIAEDIQNQKDQKEDRSVALELVLMDGAGGIDQYANQSRRLHNRKHIGKDSQEKANNQCKVGDELMNK